MADITKLAGTFKAVRYEIEVRAKDIDEIMRQLKELGLDPNPNGYSMAVARVLFRVVVPLCHDPLPSHVPTRFIEVIDECHGNIIRQAEVNLICPPALEPCIISRRHGKCTHCGNYVRLIGPIHDSSEKPKFILHRHYSASGSPICPGSGEDGTPYDGT